MMQDDDGRLVEAIAAGLHDQERISVVWAKIIARCALSAIAREGYTLVPPTVFDYERGKPITATIKDGDKVTLAPEIARRLGFPDDVVLTIVAAPKQG